MNYPIAMPNALQVAIRQLADTFAQGVVDALHAASLEEVQGEASSRRRPGRRRRTAAAPTPKRKARRPTHETGVDTLLDDLVELLEQSPNGLRSEDLRAQLKADKGAFQVIVKEALAAALIKKAGEKRSTTFFSAGS